MRIMRRLAAGFLVLFAVALLSGCATVPPYATEESMTERVRCLDSGGLWIETQDRYGCRAMRGEPL